MYYRNVLTKVVNDEVYVKLDKEYKFKNKYVNEWLEDRISEIDDQNFIRILKEKKMIREEGPSCKIVSKNIVRKLHIQLNDTCMCKCEHCYVGDNEKQVLDFNDIKDIIDTFIEHGITEIDYSGGEPTLHPEFSQIVQYGKKQGLHQMLFTNGYIKEELYDIIINNIDIIQVSIDGPQELHNRFRKNPNVFQRAINTLEILKEHSLKKYISMSITKDNVEYIPYVSALAEVYHAKLRVSPPVPVGRYSGKDNEYYKDIIKQVEETCKEHDLILPELIVRDAACGAISKTLYMDAKKNIYPCPLMSDVEYKIGNFSDNELKEIIDSSSAKEIRRKIDRVIDNTGKCIFFCPAYLFNMDCSNGFFGERNHENSTDI